MAALELEQILLWVQSSHHSSNQNSTVHILGLNLCSGKSNQRTVTPFWVESFHLYLLSVTVQPFLLALQGVFGSLHSSGEDGKGIVACPLQAGLLNLRKGQGLRAAPSSCLEEDYEAKSLVAAGIAAAAGCCWGRSGGAASCCTNRKKMRILFDNNKLKFSHFFLCEGRAVNALQCSWWAHVQGYLAN